MRDIRIDSLRGILLVIMTINHLNGGVSQLTSEPFGFVSAAEGFVLLSAYTMAITWKKCIFPLSTMVLNGSQRAWKIYKYHATLLVLLGCMALLSSTYPHYWSEMFFTTDGSLMHSIVAGLLLVHQPMYCDILPMYVIFSLATPFLLRALQGGYMRHIFMLSVFIWVLGQWVHPVYDLDEVFTWDVRSGLFNLLSWQLLWVVGLLTGFRHVHEGNNPAYQRRAIIIAAAALVFFCFLCRHEILTLPTNFSEYFEKSTMSVLRVANVVAQLILAFYILTLLPRNTNLPWFSFLGRYSLQVFTYHVFIIYAVMPFSWRINRFGIVADVLFDVLIVASLSIPIWLYRGYRRCVQRYLLVPKKIVD